MFQISKTWIYFQQTEEISTKLGFFCKKTLKKFPTNNIYNNR
nr:MAG TPA: hypothetical protein [Bacteriophage sp.]